MVKNTDVVAGVNWTEKYRPTSLDDLALSSDNRAVLESYLAAGEIPHLLMVGPPGTGKTTISRILYNTLDCHRLVLNASAERGIDVVRDKIGSFVTALHEAQWSIVLLDEADAMTADAQTALRNLMESYAEHARFILTANRGYKIIGAIQSRCQLLELTPPPFKERYRILQRVLIAEGIVSQLKLSPDIVMSYAERHTDLRRMLWAAQHAYLASGKKDFPSNKVAASTEAATLLEMVLKKNWSGVRRVASSELFDTQQALTDLFWAVPDEHPRAGFLRHTFGRGVHETGFTPDPVILFLGVCAEVMESV